jgi:hypothetical protein
MRYLLFITVALAGFATGVLSSNLFFRTANLNDMAPVATLESDEWHRLFEAAYMSGDDRLRDEALGRLQCIGDDHSLTLRRIQVDSDLVCVDFNGKGTRLRFQEDNVFSNITKTHVAWSLKHLDFVRSVIDRRSAKAYVRSHVPQP